MRPTPRSNVRALAAGLLLLLLAACGSSSPAVHEASTIASATAIAPAAASATTRATTGSSASTSATPATTARSGSAASGCGGAAVAVEAVIGTAPAVTGIKVIGGCMVSVATTLEAGDAGASAARDLCDKAAEVAYAAGAKSFSVDSAVKHELAAGIKGSPCIGEP